MVGCSYTVLYNMALFRWLVVLYNMALFRWFGCGYTVKYGIVQPFEGLVYFISPINFSEGKYN